MLYMIHMASALCFICSMGQALSALRETYGRRLVLYSLHCSYNKHLVLFPLLYLDHSPIILLLAPRYAREFHMGQMLALRDQTVQTFGQDVRMNYSKGRPKGQLGVADDEI